MALYPSTAVRTSSPFTLLSSNKNQCMVVRKFTNVLAYNQHGGLYYTKPLKQICFVYTATNLCQQPNHCRLYPVPSSQSLPPLLLPGTRVHYLATGARSGDADLTFSWYIWEPKNALEHVFPGNDGMDLTSDNQYLLPRTKGARGSAEALCYKPEGLGFDSR
jgi:hypothetical protein